MKGLCEQTDCSRVVDVGSGQVTDLYSANQPSVHVVTVGTESVYIRKSTHGLTSTSLLCSGSSDSVPVLRARTVRHRDRG